MMFPFKNNNTNNNNNDNITSGNLNIMKEEKGNFNLNEKITDIDKKTNEQMNSINNEQFKNDYLTGMNNEQVKNDYLTGMNNNQIKNDYLTEMNNNQIKNNIETGFINGDRNYNSVSEAQANNRAYTLHKVTENFWSNEFYKAKNIPLTKNINKLPLARIRRVMKIEEGIKMISQEVPHVFDMATEAFIKELTIKAWINTKESNRKIVTAADILKASKTSNMYDFLYFINNDDARYRKLLHNEFNHPSYPTFQRNTAAFNYNNLIKPYGSLNVNGSLNGNEYDVAYNRNVIETANPTNNNPKQSISNVTDNSMFIDNNPGDLNNYNGNYKMPQIINNKGECYVFKDQNHT